MDPERLAAVRARVAAGDTTLAPALAKLRQDADEALQQKPVSVMDKAVAPPSGDKHDYLSQGIYWWPDPAKPDGLPYINRDGQINPESKKITDERNLVTHLTQFGIDKMALGLCHPELCVCLIYTPIISSSRLVPPQRPV